jgi:hypothetical protein
MLREVLEYAERFGLCQFPCIGKKPAHKGWQAKATNVRTTLEQLFMEEGVNDGVPTGERNQIVVVDVDEKGIGRELFKMRRRIIKTIVETPHGVHFFFKHPGVHVHNAVKARMSGIPVDIRGDGGYVIFPPSQNGSLPYKFVEGYEFDPAKLEVFDPKWIQQKEVTQQPIIENDVLRRISRARLWLAKRDPAISGQGGHKQMFSACCAMVQKFRLSIEQAWPLILEYNSRCAPPFSEKEIRHKISDAFVKTNQ